MVKVTNIKVVELDFAKEKSPQFKQCLTLVPNLLEFLPKKPQYEVRFELHDTNTDIANAVRRCILNETPIKSLYYDPYADADVSDPYILSDFLQKQIDLIPIAQERDYEDYTISFYAENKTDEIIDVTTNNFTIKNGGKVVATEDVMSPLITLCRLRPEEFIKINNIATIEGIGRDDGGAFSSVSGLYYEPLDVKPLDAEKNEGASSMVSNPTKFGMGYSTHRNIDKPFSVVVKACDALIDRLELMNGGLAKISSKEDYYYSDLIQLETNGTIKEIQFKNENWTTINLIARYCYILTKGNIKFVAPSIIHPEKEIGVIRITHPEYLKLMQNSIKKSIEELNVIRKAFK